MQLGITHARGGGATPLLHKFCQYSLYYLSVQTDNKYRQPMHNHALAGRVRDVTALLDTVAEV